MKRLFLLLVTFFASSLIAQESVDLSYYLPKNVSYNANIPTPKSVLGFEVGEWHVSHDKLLEYLKVVSNSSERLNFEIKGKSYEDRPIVLLTITSKENHQNIDEIQKEHLKLIDGTLKIDTSAMPVVVYQGFSVHGNEPSGVNASLVLAYYLAAAEGKEIENMLKNTIILLDPALNPDGVQRFAYWANTNKSEHLNTDSNDREFHEVWPGGRTNHYWFDLNRDWLPVQLPESKARVATFRKWMPNISTDHHEMGSNSSFFFQPGVQSRVHPLTPKQNQVLTKQIGNYHAKALDKIGSLYFTEEMFDDFYYGKGSTYPDVNGGVGILFEQGSSRGHAQETINGILTFPFTIKNQFATALSTLKAAQDLRVDLLNYQHNFFKDVLKEATKDKTKAIVFGDLNDKSKVFHLAEILKRHDIDFHKLTKDFKVNNTNYSRESSYIIPTNQKNNRLIKAMFEKRTTFKDSLFYDISAWTFPLAFNLDYSELKSTDNIGELVNLISLPKGKLDTESKIAYVMNWHEFYTPKALNIILNKGIRAKVGMKPFTVDANNFDYGSILIPVQNQSLNNEALYNFLNEVALESNVEIFGVSTGLTSGIDLGSNQFRALEKQKVAMIVGDGVSSYDAGEIWHLFDQRYKMNITKIDERYLNRVNLEKYTTIILPSSNLKLSTSTTEKLKSWVKSGGVIIGYKKAVKWLSANNFISLKYKMSSKKAKNISFEQRRNFTGAQVIGGAIFETTLDRSHPINFGFSNTKLPMFRRTKLFIEPDSLSFNNPIKYSKSPLLSGYISSENLDVLKNTVPFQAKKFGAGKVIVFTDNTNFRAFWFGTNKLLMNAVFFGKAM